MAATDEEMRIDDVRVTRSLATRTDPDWRTSTYAAGDLDMFRIELSSGGLVGVGGVAAHELRTPARVVEQELRDAISPLALGASLHEATALRRAVAQREVSARAFLALDLALHDLVGKAAGFPCYLLWGGRVRESLNVIRMVGLKAPDQLLHSVETLAAEGYTHFKIKIGEGIPKDVEKLRELRRAFGDVLWIGVDANGAYDPEDAIVLSKELLALNVQLFEQPTPYEDIDALARVRAGSSIPVMADQSVMDVRAAWEICQKRAADVVSIKLTKMGSVERCRRVAALCSAAGIKVHLGGSAGPSVVDAALAHLGTVLEDSSEDSEVGESAGVVGAQPAGFEIRDGKAFPLDTPGLGAV